MSKSPKIEIKWNENELVKTIENAQQNYLNTQSVKCPHCGVASIPHSQKYNCSVCGKEITVVFD